MAIEPKESKSLKHCHDTSERVRSVIAPLEDVFGINHFFYTEMFPDRSKAYFLASHFEAVKNLIDISEFSAQHNQFLNEIPEGEDRRFLWPQETSDKVGLMLRAQGIQSGVSFIFKSENSIKNIGFASNLRSDRQTNIYLNNDNIFYHYIKYFESEVLNKIGEKEKEYVNFNVLLNNDVLNKNLEKLNFLTEQAIIKRFLIPDHSQKAGQYLTRREYLCLSLMCKGKYAKEIAYELGISSRTVEVYIRSCKGKLSAKNKSELIRKSIDLGIGRLFL